MMLGSIDTFAAVVDLEIQSTIRNVLVPKFWKHIHDGLVSSKLQGWINDQALAIEALPDKNGLFTQFIDAINELHDSFQSLMQVKPRLIQLVGAETKPTAKTVKLMQEEGIKNCLRDCLLAQLPPNFSVVVGAFYWVHFKLFTKASNLALTTVGMYPIHTPVVPMLTCFPLQTLMFSMSSSALAATSKQSNAAAKG